VSKPNTAHARDYLHKSETSRERRLKWWKEARFSMFVHWGLYAQLARHE